MTTLQRDAQAFAVEQSKLNLDVAQTAIRVLENYTKRKTQVELESVRDSNKQKMASEKAAFEQEEKRLRRYEEQLTKCEVYAPDDGMVVYANEQQQRRGSSSRTSAVEDGAIMIERQTMIRLPDLSHMQVKCTVHESKIDSLKRGMRARIRIQDHEYQGIVTSVANQPEPGDWFSGNVREYATVVSIESDPHGLRPGLTAAVEILVANVPNVLSVPVQAVVEKRGKFYCWINDGGVPKRRDVVLGVSNNTRIEIKDGVAEGDEVLLNPRAAVDEASEDEHTEENVDVKQRFGGDKPASLPPPSGGAPAVAGNGPPKLDIASLDKDGDKKISKEEAPERMKEFFDKLDSNSDGFIDAKELAALRSRRGGGPGGPEGGPGGPPGAPGAPAGGARGGPAGTAGGG